MQLLKHVNASDAVAERRDLLGDLGALGTLFGWRECTVDVVGVTTMYSTKAIQHNPVATL